MDRNTSVGGSNFISFCLVTFCVSDIYSDILNLLSKCGKMVQALKDPPFKRNARKWLVLRSLWIVKITDKMCTVLLFWFHSCTILQK